MTSAFATAREGAMRTATPQAAGVLWWRAQLRRRRDVMEQLERPGRMIFTWTGATSIVLLLAVLLTAWKQPEWLRLEALLASAQWNPWVAGSVAIVLCGFSIVAVMVGLGLTEGRERTRD